MPADTVRVRAFLLGDTKNLHDDIELLLRMYICENPNQLPALVQLQAQLTLDALGSKDSHANWLHRSLGYAVAHIPDSTMWKRLKPREKAVHGALILKPLMPEGKPTMHAPAEVDAYNAFREAFLQVADTLVDSDWATDVIPGMNEWLKKVLEG